MKKTYAFLFAFLLLTAFSANAQMTWNWSTNFGGSSSPTMEVHTTVDNAGYVYVTGLFEGTKSFGSVNLVATGSNDAYVAKFDQAGTCIWARNFNGGTNTTTGSAIAVDNAGNVYAGGQFSGMMQFDSYIFWTLGYNDIFLVKLNGASGATIWAKQIAGPSQDFIKAIDVDANSKVYISGFFTFKMFLTPTDSIYNGSAAYSDAFISRMDSSGGYNWSLKMGGNSNDQGLGLKISGTDLYSCGSFIGMANFGNGKTLTASGSNSSDAFLAKYDLNGVCQWAKKGGGNANEAALALSVDKNSYPTITGFFASSATFGTITINESGNGDMYVAHYDPGGTSLWVNKAGSSGGSESGQGIACDTMGYVVVTGNYNNTSNFSSSQGSPIPVNSAGQGDGFVAKYTPFGKLQFVISASGTSSDLGFGVAYHPTNEFYVVGNFTNSATLNPGTLTTPGTMSQNFLGNIHGFYTGINEVPNNGFFTYYPNPANDFVMIENETRNTEVAIYNSTGQLVYALKNSNEQNILVDTRNFENGFYLVAVTTNEGLAMQKLIVSH